MKLKIRILIRSYLKGIFFRDNISSTLFRNTISVELKYSKLKATRNSTEVLYFNKKSILISFDLYKHFESHALRWRKRLSEVKNVQLFG